MQLFFVLFKFRQKLSLSTLPPHLPLYLGIFMFSFTCTTLLPPVEVSLPHCICAGSFHETHKWRVPAPLLSAHPPPHPPVAIPPMAPLSWQSAPPDRSVLRCLPVCQGKLFLSIYSLTQPFPSRALYFMFVFLFVF